VNLTEQPVEDRTLTGTDSHFRPNHKRRALMDPLFRWFCFAATSVSVLFLGTVIGAVLLRVLIPAGEDPNRQVSPISRLTEAFGLIRRLVTTKTGLDATESGFRVGLISSAWLLFFVVVIAVPVGVGAAVYLEEYCGKSRWKSFVQMNIANLAGVPSIVFGLLGLALFQRGLGFRSLALGPCLLAGALTLSLLILPVIVIATQEALRAVPKSLRLAALALGATRWQMIRDHLLPAASPGILTGTILGVSRAIGETAPLLMVGAAASLLKVPSGPFDRFTALPVEIYYAAREPGDAYSTVAAGGILILLCLLLSMNFVAIWIRQRTSRRQGSASVVARKGA
jgi:phosphate transport system permease protein